jgi:uncharacterized protein
MIAETLNEAVPLTHSEGLDSLKARYSTEKFYIEQCDVGLGVFANRDIAPGELILAIEGPMIDFAETKRRGPRECMAIQIGYNNYIDTRPPGVFVNHSCEPNAGIRQNKHLVALRPIRKGEEIRYDYSTTMEEQSFTMRCLCGAPGCRKVVRDFSTLPRQLQEHYISQGIVMSFILERLHANSPTEGHRPGRKGANSAIGAYLRKQANQRRRGRRVPDATGQSWGSTLRPTGIRSGWEHPPRPKAGLSADQSA